MNLPLLLAKRYLVSKKSHNAINVISLVSLCGVAVITTALICTLSVFNGFQDLISSLYSAFDPQLRIEVVRGKTFSVNDPLIAQIRGWDEVAVFAEVLEETGLVQYKERQLPATIKGVSNNFEQLAAIDSLLVSGHFLLNDSVVDYANMGIGLASQLGVNAGFLRPLNIYMPKRTGKVSMTNPSSAFNEDRLFVASVFRVNQAQYDDNIIIAPISFIRDMFGDDTMVSSVELRLKEDADIDKVQKRLKKMLGPGYSVLNRMQQQQDSFRIMQIEKWMTFLILVFILMIASFNVIGSLSMLIIDKKADIDTLRNLGADSSMIKRVFLIEGWLISGVGALIGIVIGSLLCIGQQHFGWLSLGGSAGMFIVDAYPVKLIFTDVLWVMLMVSVLSFLASFYAVKGLKGVFDK